MERRWIKYAIAFGAGLVAVLLLMWMRGFWAEEAVDYTTQHAHLITRLDKIRIVSDAFFIVGALMASFGALLFVSSHGAFDGIVYAVKSLTWFFRFRDDTLRKKKYQSFYEYKEEKAAKPRAPFLFLVIVGAAFLLIAVAFTAVFFKIG